MINQELVATPVRRLEGARELTNSRDVAAFFGKEHRDVLRRIDRLIVDEPELGQRNFVQGYYTLDATGDQQHRCYDMDRDGFIILATGFTWAKEIR